MSPEANETTPAPPAATRVVARSAGLRTTAPVVTTPDVALERLARLAARVLDTAEVVVARLDAGAAQLHGLPTRWVERREQSLIEALCRQVAEDGPLVVDDVDAGPNALDSHVATALRFRACIGVPLRTAGGQRVGAVCAFDERPRPWTTKQLGALEELQEAAMVELELRDAARGLLARATEAESLVSGQRQLLEMIAGGDALPDTLATLARLIEDRSDGLLCSVLLVDDEQRLRFGAGPSLPPAYNAAIDGVRIGPAVGSCGTAAFRRAPVVVSDIAQDPLWADYRALAAEHGLAACWSTPILTRDGAVLGTFGMYYHEPRTPSPREWRLIDEAVHLAGIAIERARTEDALRDSAELLRAIAEGTADAMFAKDRDGHYLMINSVGARLIGAEVEDVVGRTDLALFDWSTARAIMEHDREILVSGETRTYEEVVTHQGITRTYLATKGPYRDRGGNIVGIVGVARDITARKQAEQRQRFLVEAGQVLSSSLDYETTLASVVSLCLPTLADYVLIDLLDEGDQMRRVAAEHANPGMRALMEEARRYPTDMSRENHPVARVVRTGVAELIPAVSEQFVPSTVIDDAHRELLQALHPRSYMMVPLPARGRILGAIVFARAEVGNPYTPDDLALATELGRRAALAVDNARLFHEAQRACAEAESANRAKSQFLAMMSHELRTPLNAIAGYAELLEMGLRGPVTDTQREDLGRIRASQRHLLGIITDVLDVARLEAGQLEFHVADVPLDALLAGLHELVEPQLRARQIRYECRVAGSGATVRADPEKLRQVLLNLLSNALKFTDRGGEIVIDYELDAREARIRVRDTGRGIPADKLELIFEPFVQVENGLARRAEGTGLGLAISRDLARGMHGEISVASTPGVGSTFTVTLPR